MSFVNPKGNLASAPKEAVTIEYKGVVNADGSKGNFFNQPNFVKSYQRIYQSGAEFVHVKTPRDKSFVGAVMVGSVISIAISVAGLLKMALPKKN